MILNQAFTFCVACNTSLVTLPDPSSTASEPRLVRLLRAARSGLDERVWTQVEPLDRELEGTIEVILQREDVYLVDYWRLICFFTCMHLCCNPAPSSCLSVARELLSLALERFSISCLFARPSCEVPRQLSSYKPGPRLLRLSLWPWPKQDFSTSLDHDRMRPILRGAQPSSLDLRRLHSWPRDSTEAISWTQWEILRTAGQCQPMGSSAFTWRSIAGKKSEHFRPRSPRPCLDITQWPLTIISSFLATRVPKTSSAPRFKAGWSEEFLQSAEVMTFPKLSGRSCPRYCWALLVVLFMHWTHPEWWPTSRHASLRTRQLDPASNTVTCRALHVMESTTWTMGCSKYQGNVCAVQRCHGFSSCKRCSICRTCQPVS